jgi:hypothetical protein
MVTGLKTAPRYNFTPLPLTKQAKGTPAKLKMHKYKK